MTEKVFKIFGCWSLVGFSAETSHALAANVRLWLLEIYNYNVDSQVKLKTFKCQWIVDISLYYDFLVHCIR